MTENRNNQKYKYEEVEIDRQIYYEVQVLLATGYCVCSHISGYLRFKNERMAELEVKKRNNLTSKK